MRLTLLAALFLLMPGTLPAQWQLQDAHTSADLRGIHSLGNGVAWASGTNGTVLRTEDAGFVWQLCAIPPNAEHLDFRAIQAFDNNTAIVMSSGKGDLSRLYKTTDGCQTWTLLFTNPDKDGFWDALKMSDINNGWLFGDPVRSRFYVASLSSSNHVESLVPITPVDETNETPPIETLGRGGFAASNSAITVPPASAMYPKNNGIMQPCEYPRLWLGTSGPGGAKIYRLIAKLPQCTDFGHDMWAGSDIPLAGSNASSGVFSLEAEDLYKVVAVGGDYARPAQSSKTAAYSADSGKTWTAATTPPHGYRSAVAYDPTHKTWITVGPNGTDISTDDGRNWRPLKPSPSDSPDADKHWNALSLPFVVGPHGRIATLKPDALTPSTKRPD